MLYNVSVRDFKKILAENGFEFVSRNNGSHEKWRNQKGELFILPCTKKTVKQGVVWQFERKYDN